MKPIESFRMLTVLRGSPSKGLMRILVIGLFVFLCLSTGAARSAPEEVIIIRHADKWSMKHPGPALNPTGYMRAVRFAYYFLEKFGEPDFLIATNPTGKHGHLTSIRELQTLAPLANILAARQRSESSRGILHPFSAGDYEDLARVVLREERFNQKTVLICWDHLRIPELTMALGVAGAMSEWPSQNFDDVYVIGYDAEGKVAEFRALRSQYPVRPQTWEGLASLP